MLRGGAKEMANPTRSTYYVVSLVPHLGRDHPRLGAGPWDPRLRAHGLEACVVGDANTIKVMICLIYLRPVSGWQQKQVVSRIARTEGTNAARPKRWHARSSRQGCSISLAPQLESTVPGLRFGPRRTLLVLVDLAELALKRVDNVPAGGQERNA